MAKAISNEELQLRKRARRRLVGAIALVVIVVVFVPMILDNEPQPVSQDISIELPPPSLDAGEVEPPSIDAGQSTDSGDAADSGAGSDSGAASDSGAGSDSGRLRFRPVEQSDSGDATERSPAAPEMAAAQQAQPAASEATVTSESSGSTAAPAEQRFVVQLGAFSNARNATRLASKVRENRFDAYTEVVDTTNGKRTRVRVGPYPSRSAAEQARDRLKARKLTYGEPVIVRLTN